jgi:segregation and condensation protein A
MTAVTAPSGIRNATGSDTPDGQSTFSVELSAYSGPLELLLTLIREEEVVIYDSPIARVAEQFLAHIHSLGLNEAADYLEMAARLLRIKAQMLLPRGEEDLWDDPRAELVRRLLEYQQMREVVDLLERRGEERRNQFARSYLPQAPAPPQAPLALSLAELLSAVDRVLRTVREPALHEVIARGVDIPAAIEILRSALLLQASIMWSQLVERGAEPWRILSTLLGLLELAKLGELRVSQPRPFADVEITRDTAGQAA